MGQTQTVYLPPWVPSTDAEKRAPAEFTAAIKELSARAAHFVTPHAMHEHPDFSFDWIEHRPFAEAAYTGDTRLSKLLPRLVPKRCADAARAAAAARLLAGARRPPPALPHARRVSEEHFWRNYFSHVFAVKRRFEEGIVDAPAPPSASAAAAPPPPINRLLSISYPDKFPLAVKYSTDGPPLPNLSDPDRILLDALRQQATIGPCNKPRPGMWDSAEDKARYEAWKKLDTMPKAEAMHLYVQAIEVFDEDWLSWDGLQSDPIVQAFAPPPTPQNGKGDADADVVHAAVRAMRALRQSVGRLPPASLAAAREECAALQRAIDQRAAS